VAKTGNGTQFSQVQIFQKLSNMQKGGNPTIWGGKNWIKSGYRVAKTGKGWQKLVTGFDFRSGTWDTLY
jgi:hypothetical protein